MIAYSLYCQIRSLRQEQKLSVRQIARQLQITVKTVRRWLKHEYRQPLRPNRASKLDPYKARIKHWIAQHDLSAQQVLQRLREEGVQIGYTTVLEYVRLVRPNYPSRPEGTHRARSGASERPWWVWGGPTAHIPGPSCNQFERPPHEDAGAPVERSNCAGQSSV